jgi:hypothetical protein
MVLVEELLECDDCNSRANQAVEDELIGLLSSGGEIHLYCKACRNITLWRYPRLLAKRNGASFTTDPLLETFEHSDPKPIENFPPDPLLIDYQSILNGSDLGILNRRVEWDWFG